MAARYIKVFIIIFALLLIVSCTGGRSTNDNAGKTKDGVNPPAVVQKGQGKHTLREVQEFLEKDFSNYGIRISKANSRIFWSPDNKYLMFEGYKEEASSNSNITNYVILVDFDKKKMTEIKQGYLMGEPTWSEKAQSVAFNSEGIYLLNLKDRHMTEASKEGFMPVFSPDGTKLAYSNKGVCIYHLNKKENERITQKEDDIAAAWFSDNRRIFFFRNNGRKLTDGAGYEQNLSIIDTQGEKKFDDVFTENKGKFRSSYWIVQDKILHLSAGWDDEYYNYVLNFEKNKAVLLGEVDAAAYESCHIGMNKNGQIVCADDDKITIYDTGMNKLKDYTIKEDRDNGNEKINQYHRLLPDGRLMVWHKDIENGRGSIILIDPQEETQQLVVDHVLSDSICLSGDGKVAVVIEGGKRLRFFQIPAKTKAAGIAVELKKLMPENEGYEWIYNGFAEYGHNMKLMKIISSESSTSYNIEGTFQSASGFPPTEKDRFVINYTITNNSLREKVVKIGRLPHKIMEFDLIRGPLVKGTKWTESVTIDGRKTTLNCEIIKTGVDDGSRNYYKVRYQAQAEGYPSNRYVETRILKQGLGTAHFENTFNNEIDFNYQVFEGNR